MGAENFGLAQISYDKNGNILSALRNGNIGNTFGLIDNLSYFYSGNRLTGATDAVSGNADVGDFRDNPSNADFSYLPNGSLASDLNRGIASFEYNTFLKKISKINYSNGNWLSLVYNGDGTLLKKVSSTGDLTEFIDNYILKNNELFQQSIPDGRAVYEAGSWKPEFEYRDIWNNLRLSFAANGSNLVVKQTADYDAFGWSFNETSTSKPSAFKFQNQQRIDDFGLNLDLFKFRASDPQIGRLLAVDPLAESYPYNSVYALQENKFGLGIELEGRELENFLSQFKAPSDLLIKTPEKDKSQIQIYSTTVTNSKLSFAKMKETFLRTPEKLLSNSKAEFHAPENSKGEKTGLTNGNTMEIEIAGPQNDSYVKVHKVTESENRVSATFATLEGHVEKGVINFSISDMGKNGMTFTIGSMSVVDYGLAPENYARTKQKESWGAVLNNFVKITNGKETKRITK